MTIRKTLIYSLSPGRYSNYYANNVMCTRLRSLQQYFSLKKGTEAIKCIPVIHNKYCSSNELINKFIHVHQYAIVSKILMQELLLISGLYKESLQETLILSTSFKGLIKADIMFETPATRLFVDHWINLKHIRNIPQLSLHKEIMNKGYYA